MDEKKFVRLSQILAFFVEFVKTKGDRAGQTANGQALFNVGK
ncbi:hypothetical protein [Acetanaerobacterium sp. MSJ-12]|nr:hypothetical protein [Acetanaerobacterium sp. MSJ-12]